MNYDKARKKAHCFSCGADYDTLDIIGLEYGLIDDAAIFNKTYELLNLDIENDYHRATAQKDFKPEYQKKDKSEQKTQYTVHNSIYTSSNTQIIDDYKEPTYSPNFTAAIEAAHKELLNNPTALAYIEGRGITLDTIKEYKLGYDTEGYNHLLKDFPQHRSSGKKAGLYKYVFPYMDTEGACRYFLTEIEDRTQLDEYNGKYRKINKGDGQQILEAQIFNERYLKEQVPPVIFLCEGIYDALSIEEVGGKAIAFIGTAQRRFLSLCKKYSPDTTFIISLDNDPAGQQSTEKVKKGLDLSKIPYEVKTAQEGKDANEALQADRGALRDYVQAIIANAEKERQAAVEAEKEEYLQTSTAYQLQNFIDSIEKSKTATFFPTGFTSVDNLLDGGLYAGLYVIGAISSLGKTTFCLQVADNIANAGHDVLIFSLEMARNELISKSVSRLSLLEDLQQNKTTVHAKTTRGITTGIRYSSYTAEERGIIEAAIKSYAEYADHIFIHEGIGNIGVEQVRQTVEKHKRITGKAPVVLIDYLQILAPFNDRATDKQNTDKAVLELKRISRDFSIPVIGISSFNRDNYTAPVNMASFKESGAVEYSSDVLLALQYEGMDWAEGESEKDRNKRIRELTTSVIALGKQGKAQSIQVKVLKNRNGSKGDALIDFYPMFNYFTEKNKSGAAAALDDKENGWTTVASSSDNPFN